jgi:hypothetical protein
MALSKENYNFGGRTLPNAYIIVDTVSGNKNSCQVLVTIFEGTSREGTYIGTINHQMPVDITNTAPNFIKQGYMYLKQLPDFSTAIDV